MAIMPGVPAMPTVMTNLVLSLLKDGSYPVRGTDTLSVISPMYNEEDGARASLQSLLAQRNLPEQIAISINGGTDRTYEVVCGTLRDHGYQQETCVSLSIGAQHSTWRAPVGDNIVTIVLHEQQTAKSDSVNTLVAEGIVTTDRVIVVDGDTVFDPNFIGEIRDNFYRLRVRRTHSGPEYVLENYAMQSGAVMSYAAADAPLASRFISAGREAEYAFGCAIKDGQSRQVGTSALGGRSRVYTVIGCGFGARRDLFPLPSDTKTEDHDFTLASQNLEPLSRTMTFEEFRARGFRVVIGGEEKRPEAVMDAGDTLRYVRSGNTRFAQRALMWTQDPPHFNGYLNQVERWFGGGHQNALKRLRQPLKANVGFTVLSAILENILGILLLLSIPLGLSLYYGNPSMGFMPRNVLLGFLFDIVVMTLLTAYGFYRFYRAQDEARGAALFRCLGAALRSALPFTVLRYLNPLPYVASACQVVPEFLRQGSGLGSWERPSVRRRTETQRLLLPGISGLFVVCLAAAQVAAPMDPVNAEAYRLVYDSRVVLHARDYLNSHPWLEINIPGAWDNEHEPQAALASAAYAPPSELSLSLASNPLPFGELLPGGSPLAFVPSEEMWREAAQRSLTTAPQAEAGASRYCAPSFTPWIDAPPQLLSGDADAYQELGVWSLIALARLVPLTALLEDAVTAYDVPLELYLRVLLHESWLDPLAQGPTEDYGLSQVTSDALTMLRELSRDGRGHFYNPYLITQNFNLFDPDFSACAGAAKLAWALKQPQADTQRKAYALYINPLHGLHNGEISDIHMPLTEGVVRLEPLAESLMAVYARYAVAPESLAPAERELMVLAEQVRGGLTVESAYREVYGLVQSYNIPDLEVYERLFRDLYGSSEQIAGLPQLSPISLP